MHISNQKLREDLSQSEMNSKSLLNASSSSANGYNSSIQRKPANPISGYISANNNDNTIPNSGLNRIIHNNSSNSTSDGTTQYQYRHIHPNQGLRYAISRDTDESTLNMYKAGLQHLSSLTSQGNSATNDLSRDSHSYMYV